MVSIESFKSQHLLVAGEVGIDEYIWGDTRRISPEAPVPVIEVESQDSKLGLAANVALNVVSLGAKTTLVSVRGDDSDGERLESMVREAGIDSVSLITDNSRPTLRKTRVIAQKQHVVRVDYERSHPLSPEVTKEYNQQILSLLPEVDGVILQDYGKGIWTAETVTFISEARRLGVPVYVDPSRLSPLSLYRGVTLLTPNLMEAEALCSRGHRRSSEAGKDNAYLSDLAEKILDVTSADHAVITCGGDGMISLDKKTRTFQRIPTFAKEVFDVTGAGDTVVAVMALAMGTGRPIGECMQVANAAAGVVVGKVGAAQVSPTELRDELTKLETLRSDLAPQVLRVSREASPPLEV